MNAAERSSAYAEKLLRPEWRLKRLEVLERDRFTCRECGARGGRLDVHHAKYLHDTEPWDHPLDLLLTLCRGCHESVTKIERENRLDFGDGADTRRDIRIMVGSLARKKSLPRPDGRRLDADLAWTWIRRHFPERAHREAMKFAGWLASTGLSSPSVIIVLEDYAKRLPDSPYAYYRPGGEGRECLLAKHAISLAEKDNEAFKSADRAYLARNRHSPGIEELTDGDWNAPAGDAD